MNKDEIKEISVAKTEYTFDMLLNDIFDNSDENLEESDADDKAEREYQHKRVVMQMLVYFAALFNSVEYNDDDKLGRAIAVKVNADELLSGYLFHVSQNPQFDYSWNYLRKRKNSYCNFLVDGIRFINNVIADINMLACKTCAVPDVHVVFDDIFDVALINEKPYVQTSVLWENFNRVAAVKRFCNISVKVKDCLLVASSRRDLSDTEKIIDDALDMVKSRTVESESKVK